jgi:hypothetical protein
MQFMDIHKIINYWFWEKKMNNENAIVLTVKAEMVLASGVEHIMASIRTEWKEKRLIQRVRTLLPSDPSSACQRILNAAIHDLRNKIVIAGLDIAQEAATRFRLPSVGKPEDVLETYSVSHIIDLSYRMGLLSRPEWRRVSRCYEIRRDLEHEDDDYEATVEDCIYIFKTCVEVILSQDPLELIRVSDIQTAINTPNKISPSVEMIDNYKKAPHPRQLQIIELLVNTALDSGKADIVRQNSMELLRSYRELTITTVLVELAEQVQKRIAKRHIDLTMAKVAYAAGILAYLKQRQVEEFFQGFLNRFETTGYHWRHYSEHPKLFDDFEDVGGLSSCPESLKPAFVLWFTLCYLGEPGGYGMGSNRPVFYSNSAAPRIEKLFSLANVTILPHYEVTLREPRIAAAIRDKHIARRSETLLDLIQVN